MDSETMYEGRTMSLIFYKNLNGGLLISTLPNRKKVLLDKSQELDGFEYGIEQQVTIVKELPKVAFAYLGETDKTTNNQIGRRSEQYQAWREAVINKYNGQCYFCGAYSTVCHHIKSWANHPDARYDPENGVVLCQRHHAWADLLMPNRWQLRLIAWLYRVKRRRE